MVPGSVARALPGCVAGRPSGSAGHSEVTAPDLTLWLCEWVATDGLGRACANDAVEP